LGDEVIREAERDFEKQLDAISEFTGVSKKRILQILMSESTFTLVFDLNARTAESVAIGTDGISVYGIQSNR